MTIDRKEARMRVGLAVSVLDLESWRPRSLAQIVAEAEWAEASGFDSIWISDHLFMTRGDERVAGLEPLTTLAYLAARTSKLTLGTHVLCNNFRNVGQLAREIATLVEATETRLTVGLGCGAQRSEHEAFGLPFQHRVGRLEESLTVLPRLLRGEVVSFDGRFVRLREASITTTGHVPPFWVAAFRPRMIGIAARLADGWAGNWNGRDTTDFRAQVAEVREAVAAAGRAAAPFEIVAGLLAVPNRGRTAELAERAERLLPAPAPVTSRVIFGDADELAGALAAYRDAGATYALVAPGPRQFSSFEGSDRRELAAAVAALARTTRETAGAAR
jgi:alkanesulfonate monooxygenase SsuD/methylene tetrahydromethanopterin reductase-like flavin-dependent oxidoreductase (luciferase family)